MKFCRRKPGRRRSGHEEERVAEKRISFRLIDARIAELADWRGEMLAKLRALIKEADPQVVEEWKWRGVPVWSHDGLICTGETYKSVVKMTFAKGAALKDPSRLFNSSLEGNTRRAIDFREGETIDEKALKTLIRAAVALNKVKSLKLVARIERKRNPGGLPAVWCGFVAGADPDFAAAQSGLRFLGVKPLKSTATPSSSRAPPCRR